MSDVYTFSTGVAPTAVQVLDAMRDTIRDLEYIRAAYVDKYGHEPIEDVRSCPHLRGSDYAVIIGGVAFVSDDVLLSFDTARRFDAWMDRLEVDDA